MRKYLLSKKSSETISSGESEQPAKKLRTDTTELTLVSTKTTIGNVPTVSNWMKPEESLVELSEIKDFLSADQDTWIERPGLLFKKSSTTNTNSEKMIAFDLDGTIITTKSGKKFATDHTDWKFFSRAVATKLQQLHKEGVYLVILSNQSGVMQKKTTVAEVTQKIDAVVGKIGVPMDVVCALQGDKFRKPCSGMWELLVSTRVTQAKKHESMYVGDAAGRPKSGPRPKDFADSDLKFALNFGVQFNTPEKFFLGDHSPLHTKFTGDLGPILAREPVVPPANEVFLTPSQRKIGTSSGKTENETEIVLLVAPPACGKTTLCKLFERNGFQRVNQDTLGSIGKCLEKAKEILNTSDPTLNAKRSVVVDNTNIATDIRRTWVKLAQELNIPIRVVRLQTSKEVCFQLSAFRWLDPRTSPADRRKIDSIVINTFFKRLEEPRVAEGFYRIDYVTWSPEVPSNPASRRLFHMYLR